jgi:hypothetical protein
MNADTFSTGTVPKLALNRIETAQAIGQSPATVDRLTKRGLLCPSRATRRPIYAVKEIERFLKATTANPDWTPSNVPGQPGQFPADVPRNGGGQQARHTPTAARSVRVNLSEQET